MSLSNNKFNQEWRDAFKDASENPPLDLWDKIEAKLDQQELPKRAIWWKNAPIWYAAASILLLTAIGIALYLPATTDSLTPVSSVASTTVPSQESTVVTDNDKTTPISKEHQFDSAPTIASRSASLQKEYKSISNDAVPNNAIPIISQDKSETFITVTNNFDPPLTELASDSRQVASVSVLEDDLQYISPKEYTAPKVYFQERFVFHQTESPIQPEPVANVNKAENYWAGINVMPASFNPNLRINSTNVYHSMYAPTHKTNAEKGSLPNFSYAVAAQGGVKLSKHLSIETGISFLQGNSNFKNSGTYMDLQHNQSTNLLLSALQSGDAEYALESPVSGITTQFNKNSTELVYVSRENLVQNNFQYLQLPAYVGYTIRPDNKLSYTILGGGLANLFLKNDLEVESGTTLRTTPANNVYNTVSWAAGTGLRVNFKVNEQISTTLTGSFQQGLESTFKSNDFLTSRPQVYGISWGVRYNFK